MFDLNRLKASDAEMPESRRGRQAEPIPEQITEWVKDSYAGAAKSVKVPNGEATEKGNDANVVAFVGMLRRAANSLGLGLSVKIMEPTSRTTEVLFKAKDKTERRRAEDAETPAEDRTEG